MVKCLANLKQWNLQAAMFTESNNGKFWKSDNGHAGLLVPQVHGRGPQGLEAEQDLVLPVRSRSPFR